jgi:ribosomal 30S subunit maturation factor RimM
MAERTPLEAGEFFQSELVGCQVIDRSTGESLGRVEGWEDAGGAGLLAVEGGLLIPFARSICVEIDPAARRIVVELPEGLKDLNRS